MIFVCLSELWCETESRSQVVVVCVVVVCVGVADLRPSDCVRVSLRKGRAVGNFSLDTRLHSLEQPRWPSGEYTRDDDYGLMYAYQLEGPLIHR
eukprot:7374495-Prymnesium_polylepis.1